MKEKKNVAAFPPIEEDVYGRFDDDGWGIRDVKLTKRGEEALAQARKGGKSNDDRRNKREA